MELNKQNSNILETARQRILYFIDKQKIKPSDFLEMTGLKKGFIDKSHAKSGASDLFLSNILEAYPNLSADWLLTGKGSMLRDYEVKNIVQEAQVVNEEQVEYKKSVIPPTPYLIEINPQASANCLVADVRASAGFGSLLESKSRLDDLPAISLLNAPYGLNVAFQIEGDSMHNTIRHLDYVAGNHITDIADLKDGYVYIVIEKSGGATCKRVYKEKGVFRLISDNPTYPEYILGQDDVLGFFKAFQRFSTDFRNYHDDVRSDVRDLKKRMLSLEQKLLK